MGNGRVTWGDEMMGSVGRWNDGWWEMGSGTTVWEMGNGTVVWDGGRWEVVGDGQ